MNEKKVKINVLHYNSLVKGFCFMDLISSKWKKKKNNINKSRTKQLCLVQLVKTKRKHMPFLLIFL